MFSILFPTEARIRTIQNREESFYWSSYLPALFRKHGLLSVRASNEEAEGDFLIVTRQSQMSLPRPQPGYYEQPETVQESEGLSVGHRGCIEERVDLFDAQKSYLGALETPAMLVREIPAVRGVLSEPEPYRPADRRWLGRGTLVHEVHHQSPWEPILFAAVAGGGLFPVVVSDGRRIFSGVPLIDAACRAHSFPPLDVGYYSMLAEGLSGDVEPWLVEQLVLHAVASGEPVVRIDPWPSGYSSALTIRHDYDRPMALAEAKALLDFYDEGGFKSSWGFLVRSLDPPLMRELHQRGHEVALHSEARDADEFVTEVERINEVVEVSGFTAHGGIGSPGYLGSTQLEWAEAAGLSYGEILGRSTRLPHQACIVRDGLVGPSRLHLPPTHHSLDASTKPDAHYLEDLCARLPEYLGRGDHAVVMNHPDIHLGELRRLLLNIDQPDVWKVTIEDAVAWVEVTRTRAKYAIRGSCASIDFPNLLPLCGSAGVVGTDIAAEVGEGSSALSIPLQAGRSIP